MRATRAQIGGSRDAFASRFRLMNHDRHPRRLRRHVVASSPGRRILRRLRRGAHTGARRGRGDRRIQSLGGAERRVPTRGARDRLTFGGAAESRLNRPAVTLLPATMFFTSCPLLRGAKVGIETECIVVEPRASSKRAASCARVRDCTPGMRRGTACRCSSRFARRSSVTSMSANNRSTMFFSSVNS